MDRSLFADDFGPQALPGADGLLADAVGQGATPDDAAPRRPTDRPHGPQSQDVMSGETLQRTVTITNPQGFHLRPAAAFARSAGKFRSEVILLKGDLRVNGKSMLDLLSLVALEGTQVTLQVTGPDAPAALAELADLLAASGGDDDDDTDDPGAAPDSAPLPQKG